jgi:Zn finger protein HypA/HybF involved in hydrogenase expression
MGFLDFASGRNRNRLSLLHSHVSAGTYSCTECGKEITTGSVQSLPPCPICHNNSWEAVTGGDAVADPRS